MGQTLASKCIIHLCNFKELFYNIGLYILQSYSISVFQINTSPEVTWLGGEEVTWLGGGEVTWLGSDEDARRCDVVS